MAFPDVRGFPASHPGPYEVQMGGFIAALLRLFGGRVPDPESNARVLELASLSVSCMRAIIRFGEISYDR